MKLYAKVTSERASKGQGGEWLDVEIVDTNRDRIMLIQIYENPNVYDNVTTYIVQKEYGDRYKNGIYTPKQKGEKQKGERYCENCAMQVAGDKHHNCIVCGSRTT